MVQGRDHIEVAGILAFLCGGLGITAAILIFANWQKYHLSEYLMGVVVLAAAVLSIWGTRRYVLRCQNYKLAILFGGICSVICGLIFGVIALIFIITSKRQFEERPLP